MTPTSRTLNLLRKEGKLVEVVEKWNPFSGQRKDLFGFIDILAIDVENKQTWGIQCTSRSNVNARKTKICEECREASLKWLQAGNFIEIIGWSKKGAKNKRKTWQSYRIIITIKDFEPTE